MDNETDRQNKMRQKDRKTEGRNIEKDRKIEQDQEERQSWMRQKDRIKIRHTNTEVQNNR